MRESSIAELTDMAPPPFPPPPSPPPLYLPRGRRTTVVLRIPYYTHWGQCLVVVGSDPSLGSWNPSRALPLSPLHLGDELFWTASLRLSPDSSLLYHYCVVDYHSRRPLRHEAGPPHSFSLTSLPDVPVVEIHDLWQDASAPESFLCKSPFRDVIFQCGKPDGSESHNKKIQPDIPVDVCTKGVAVQFKIKCPRFQSDVDVRLVSEPGMQKFGIDFSLSWVEEFYWSVECVIDKNDFPLKYKYVMKSEDKTITELGPDRQLFVDESNKNQPGMIIVDDGYFKMSPWKAAGLAIPVFSLRSNEGVGVGEFLDLKLLVDFSVNCGLHVIQLLPVNDTSVNGMWWDSYPYSSLSVFALHPIYLHLQHLSKNLPESIKNEVQNARKQLDLKDLDYEATMSAKLSIAKNIFQLEKEQVMESADYKNFFHENQDWLKPYAGFCFLRDLFGTSDHSQWGVFSSFSQERLEKLLAPTTEHFGSVAFYYYLQYHLHLQLLEAANYATLKGVLLKGDLPIGVDRNSVDTWMNPTLFRMNTSTGAPPDYFDKNGQNWGFPTYNWEEMSKDKYGWWRARLKQMAKYFSAYRIDHVLGFFRIWELPDHAATGLMGRFRPSIPLSQEELEKQGIWDFERLTKPYVRSYMLQERFGEGWTEIADMFFNEQKDLFYEFKEKYNTEKKIVKELESDNLVSVNGHERKYLQQQLLDLMQEVVLLQDSENPKNFFPRFNLELTSSYKELDDGSKHVLCHLYYDYYFHRQEGLWMENAMKTLPVLLDSTNMLACGEDLGLVPACVQPVLQELGLLGLRIQRMPNSPGVEFAVPADYEYTTVCAPSCHDSSTLRAWWEEDEDRRARFYHNVLNFGSEPPEKCDPSIVYAILEQHMESPSMWAIFPLQDILALKVDYSQRPAMEECINDPTNPKHYWRFRLHILLETLLDDVEVSNEVRQLVKHSGRSAPHVEEKTTDIQDSINSLHVRINAKENGYEK